MAVQKAEDGPIARVLTTGAEFLIRKATDTIECRQRLSKQRAVAYLKFAPGTLAGIKLMHHSSGAAIFAGGGTTVRVNGDSLLMVSPGRNGEITAELAFTPDYHSEFKGNYNFFDPDGGISFFEHGRRPQSKLSAALDPVTVRWPWQAGDVFWAGVSPPKLFDWEASVRDRVVRHGSSDPRYMYPDDLSILRWAHGYANILFLHCESMWKHWQLELVPVDMAAFRRVVKTAHEVGMKVMPYASPHTFLKGTPHERRAHRDPKVGPGQFVGSNASLFLKDAARIVKEFGADGLYFDEIYSSRESLATQYFLSRAARELVGDGGILELHATTDVLGDGHTGTYFPTLHAYYNFVLKGEGEYDRIEPGYVRYYLSTYNISNSVAVAEYFDQAPSPQQIDRLLRANVRLHLPEHWFFTGQVELLRKYYWPRLTPALKQGIEPDLHRRTGVFDKFRQSVSRR